MSAPVGWLRRYQGGQRDQVWHELRQLGSAVREQDLAAEAQQVCDEMARRARHNAELLVERLTEQGCRFHSNDDNQTPASPYCPPGPRAQELADWLQRRFTAVPMTLLSWIRLVGDIWLVGTHPQWPESSSADPLVIEVEGSRHPGQSIRNFFEGEFDAWREWNTRHSGASPFVLPLAPDRLHKENVSGGPPYGIVLPDACADGLFVADTTMAFVSYLNWAFRNGGFPWPVSGESQWRVKRALAKDLLPL
jgi:hypothetical protein